MQILSNATVSHQPLGHVLTPPYSQTPQRVQALPQPSHGSAQAGSNAIGLAELIANGLA